MTDSPLLTTAAAPTRVQRKRTKGWRKPDNTIFVDRSTPFGNPFPVMACTPTAWCVGTWNSPAMWFRDTKEEAQALSVKAFRAWLAEPRQRALREKAKIALRGKNIGCWCGLTEPCHGDVWLECANAD